MEENGFVRMLREARREGRAVAAFNIVNGQTLRAVLRAARQEGLPVIVQTSAGTVRQLGVRALGGMVNAAREESGATFALHLDHCRDADLARQCALHGWDAVMMDYSALPLAQNAALTAEMARYAHDMGVAVEGEVGVIAGVEEDIIAHSESRAGYDETVAYIQSTGVDAIAPAIGTAHGVYKSAPRLDFALVQRLAGLKTPLVVHGGTGLGDDVFRRLVALGAAKMNISTAVKLSYLQGMREAAAQGLTNPLRADLIIEDAVTAMARRCIRLFSGRKADA